MIDIKDKSKCSGCHACATACPKNCISMVKDEEGFLYPSVNEKLCVRCGVCEKACPIIEKNMASSTTEAYAVLNKSEDIRLQSSSGGIFTVIAEQVIQSGGAVFGASFDEDFNIKHICVESTEELSKLRGSKYVQSTIGDTYDQAKEMLDNQRLVYFTGTPCQIEGLLKYLGKEYNNLLTSDIICHGVPSPMVWQEYLKSKSKAPVKSVSFRNKSLGWGSYSVVISFDGAPEYRCLARDDKYIKAFLSDLCLRPSCYSCAFKSKNRASDLTLADFWGVNNVVPEMNDNKGTSLVLVHTSKGKSIIELISSKVYAKEVDANTALIYNSSAIKSVDIPKNRNEFMRKISAENFEKLVQKYTKRTLLQKVKSKLKRMLKRN